MPMPGAKIAAEPVLPWPKRTMRQAPEPRLSFSWDLPNVTAQIPERSAYFFTSFLRKESKLTLSSQIISLMFHFGRNPNVMVPPHGLV